MKKIKKKICLAHLYYNFLALKKLQSLLRDQNYKIGKIQMMITDCKNVIYAILPDIINHGLFQHLQSNLDLARDTSHPRDCLQPQGVFAAQGAFVAQGTFAARGSSRLGSLLKYTFALSHTHCFIHLLFSHLLSL